MCLNLFIYLGFFVAFNTVQVTSPWVVGRAEETSTYSWSRFCTVNCRPRASNYQFSHLRPGQEPNPDLRGGRRECYHSATMAPLQMSKALSVNSLEILNNRSSATFVTLKHWLELSFVKFLILTHKNHNISCK